MSQFHEKVEDNTFSDFTPMETSIKCEIMSESDLKMEILDGSYETVQKEDLLSIKEEKNEYLYCTEVEANEIYNKELSSCKYTIKMESDSNDLSTSCGTSDSYSNDNLMDPTIGKVSMGTKKSRYQTKPCRNISNKKTETQMKNRRKKGKVKKKDDVMYSCGFCFKTFDRCRDFFSHMTLHKNEPKKLRNVEQEKPMRIETSESHIKSRKDKNTGMSNDKNVDNKTKHKKDTKDKTEKEEESIKYRLKSENEKKRTKPIESEKKIIQCDECGQTFTFHNNLLRHRNKHAGVRYTCDICKKNYNSKSYLVQHINVMHLKITNDTVFQCTICKKSLNTAYALKWHMQTHTGLKPFQCDICMKGFSNKWNLKIHIASWHK